MKYPTDAQVEAAWEAFYRGGIENMHAALIAADMAAWVKVDDYSLDPDIEVLVFPDKTGDEHVITGSVNPRGLWFDDEGFTRSPPVYFRPMPSRPLPLSPKDG